MEENTTILTKEIEETMACTAYAEAGEPCPIGVDEEIAEERETAVKQKEAKKSIRDVVEETMACTAYAEFGEPCPIGAKDEKKHSTSKNIH